MKIIKYLIFIFFCFVLIGCASNRPIIEQNNDDKVIDSQNSDDNNSEKDNIDDNNSSEGENNNNDIIEDDNKENDDSVEDENNENNNSQEIKEIDLYEEYIKDHPDDELASYKKEKCDYLDELYNSYATQSEVNYDLKKIKNLINEGKRVLLLEIYKNRINLEINAIEENINLLPLLENTDFVECNVSYDILHFTNEPTNCLVNNYDEIRKYNDMERSYMQRDFNKNVFYVVNNTAEYERIFKKDFVYKSVDYDEDFFKDSSLICFYGNTDYIDHIYNVRVFDENIEICLYSGKFLTLVESFAKYLYLVKISKDIANKVNVCELVNYGRTTSKVYPKNITLYNENNFPIKYQFDFETAEQYCDELLISFNGITYRRSNNTLTKGDVSLNFELSYEALIDMYERIKNLKADKYYNAGAIFLYDRSAGSFNRNDYTFTLYSDSKTYKINTFSFAYGKTYVYYDGEVVSGFNISVLSLYDDEDINNPINELKDLIDYYPDVKEFMNYIINTYFLNTPQYKELMNN